MQGRFFVSRFFAAFCVETVYLATYTADKYIAM